MPVPTYPPLPRVELLGDGLPYRGGALRHEPSHPRRFLILLNYYGLHLRYMTPLVFSISITIT